MPRPVIGILPSALLFVVAAALFLVTGVKRRRLDAQLKAAAMNANPSKPVPKQLGLFTAWDPKSLVPVALAPPERRWSYDQDYMIAFMGALQRSAADLGMTGLRYYAGPILGVDAWFAVFLAAFIACTGFMVADAFLEWRWLARGALVGGCLGVVYGAADVAEDRKLRAILMHAERVTSARQLRGAPASLSLEEKAAELETADAAQVDAANALTRIKLVMLAASVIGVIAFGILFVADRLVGALSGGPDSGPSTPAPQQIQSSGATSA